MQLGTARQEQAPCRNQARSEHFATLDAYPVSVVQNVNRIAGCSDSRRIGHQSTIDSPQRMRKSVAVYGGSFDPPHVSHVLAAAYALKVGGFDQVLVVPVFEHAFQKQLAPFAHRLRMCELAFSGIHQVQVSALEQTLETPSRTLHTLEHLTAEHPDWALRLLIGSDVLLEAPRWHAFDRIAALAPPYVVARLGYPQTNDAVALLPDVSSTRVREALARPETPLHAALLAQSLPSAVLAYIAEHGLYPALPT